MRIMNYELRITNWGNFTTEARRHGALSLLLCFLWLSSSATAALMPIKWVADGSDNKPLITTIAQGETRELQVTLKNYGQAVTIPNTATAELHFQTNGMGRAYWSGGVATVTTNGIVTATWTPLLDAGAPMYNFAIGVSDGPKKLYTAYGQIRMRSSPGWVANGLPQPWPSLDFATIDVFNPPWATPTIISNMIAGIEGGGGIGIEEDPKAYPVATNALAIAQGALPAFRDGPEDQFYNVPKLRIDSDEEYNSSVDIAYGTLEINTALQDMREQPPKIHNFKISLNGFLATTTHNGIDVGEWKWPDTATDSPLIKRDELQHAIAGATDTNAVSRTGDTLTGLLTSSTAGFAWQGVGVATNYIIKAEFDGTNMSFNVYEVKR